MKKILNIILSIIMAVSICVMFTGCTEEFISGFKQDVQNTIDAATTLQENQPTPTNISYSLERYNLIRKKVEYICCAMISSYKADKLTYEQHKDFDNEERQSWAEQVKMRANKTASTYNNYILKSQYVWKGNVPSDIYMTLPYIE